MFKVQDKLCETCIYKKNSPLRTELPRLEAEVVVKDGHRICHHSNDVCCRGFWNKHKDNFRVGQVAQRLDCVEFVKVDILGHRQK